MRKLFALSVSLGLLAGIAHAALPVPPAKTGDRSFDRTLQSIAAEANANPTDFWSMLSRMHGIPEPDIQAARQATGLEPQDMYMVTSIAHLTNRPVGVVAEQCKANRGKGWGVMAQEMGIKPGSPEFHRLKANATNQLSQMKSASKARRVHEKQMKREHDRQMKQESQGKGHGKSD